MQNSSNKIFIGTMSGTSYDGIDLCAISVGRKIKLLHFSSFNYPLKLRKEIASVIEKKALSLKSYDQLNINIGRAFAKAINTFILKKNIDKKNICAVGLSGQTLWHKPSGNYPFSIQAGDPEIVSQECGMTVVSDFRNDHINLGGEGAPLVPEFHHKLFSSIKQARFVLNIGGIANYSYLTKTRDFVGSDSGPGNALIDSYCQKYLKLNFDRSGLIARKGIVHEPSLKMMLSDPFFKKRQPKSTGKELFNLEFIPQNLFNESSENILATLTELTAITISKVIKAKEKSIKEVIVCGGGINNKYLLERIGCYISTPLKSSQVFGYDPQSIEAMAFGWLAQKRISRLPLIVKNSKGLLGKITSLRL